MPTIYLLREEKGTHPCHVKSDWDPPVQPSVALETYLEEVRFKLATVNIGKSKHNLSPEERCAPKEKTLSSRKLIRAPQPL